MRRTRPTLALAVALAVTTAACGGGDEQEGDPTTTTAAAAPSTSAATNSPPPPAAAPTGVAPLTGLPANPELLARPALVVKLDNAPRGRPQVGLNQADVVISEKVEDGVTRLFAIYHSADADPVGPVRSARSTDIALVTPLNRPLFAYAGTNAAHQRLLDAAPIVDVSFNKVGGVYRRQGGRPAPYNLFSSTGALRSRTPSGSKAPPPLFGFRPAGQPLAAAGAAPASGVQMEYRGRNITTRVEYRWDQGAGVWRRFQDGTPHVDSANAQVSPRNVVVQFVAYRDTGLRDRSNTAVDEAELVGSGEAWVLSDGKVVRGRWTKPSPDVLTTYTDAAGAPVALTPGQTWIELPRPGSAALR